MRKRYAYPLSLVIGLASVGIVGVLAVGGVDLYQWHAAATSPTSSAPAGGGQASDPSAAIQAHNGGNTGNTGSQPASGTTGQYQFGSGSQTCGYNTHFSDNSGVWVAVAGVSDCGAVLQWLATDGNTWGVSYVTASTGTGQYCQLQSAGGGEVTIGVFTGEDSFSPAAQTAEPLYNSLEQTGWAPSS